MSNEAKKVYDFLGQLGISYKIIEHPPVYTCEEMEPYIGEIEGAYCKNLLLRNKKGNRHFLLVMEESKQMNIKEFGKSIGVSNLSFASEERLYQYLGVKPGAVSIFGLINDENHDVEVYIDQPVMESTAVNFHPNINIKTLNLSGADFKKFLEACQNTVHIINI